MTCPFCRCTWLTGAQKWLREPFSLKARVERCRPAATSRRTASRIGKACAATITWAAHDDLNQYSHTVTTTVDLQVTPPSTSDDWTGEGDGDIDATGGDFGLAADDERDPR